MCKNGKQHISCTEVVIQNLIFVNIKLENRPNQSIVNIGLLGFDPILFLLVCLTKTCVLSSIERFHLQAICFSICAPIMCYTVVSPSGGLVVLQVVFICEPYAFLSFFCIVQSRWDTQLSSVSSARHGFSGEAQTESRRVCRESAQLP